MRRVERREKEEKGIRERRKKERGGREGRERADREGERKVRKEGGFLKRVECQAHHCRQ